MVIYLGPQLLSDSSGTVAKGDHGLALGKDLAVSLQPSYLYSWIRPITLRLGLFVLFKTKRHCSHLCITTDGCYPLLSTKRPDFPPLSAIALRDGGPGYHLSYQLKVNTFIEFVKFARLFLLV